MARPITWMSQVALLQTLDDSSHSLAGVDYGQVSAFGRPGISDSMEEINMTGGVIEVEEIKEAIL